MGEKGGRVEKMRAKDIIPEREEYKAEYNRENKRALINNNKIIYRLN